MRDTPPSGEEEGEGDEIIVMSTQRQSKKFEMLRKQRGVALLIHDFSQNEGSVVGEDGERVEDACGGVYSITLNGDCTIVSWSVSPPLMEE